MMIIFWCCFLDDFIISANNQRTSALESRTCCIFNPVCLQSETPPLSVKWKSPTALQRLTDGCRPALVNAFCARNVKYFCCSGEKLEMLFKCPRGDVKGGNERKVQARMMRFNLSPVPQGLCSDLRPSPPHQTFRLPVLKPRRPVAAVTSCPLKDRHCSQRPLLLLLLPLHLHSCLYP